MSRKIGMSGESGMGEMSLSSVPEGFGEKFPDLSPEKQQKLYNRYLKSVSANLLKYLSFGDGKVYNFPMDLANKMSGDFKYKKQRYYVWREFYPLMPFFNVIEKGSNLNKQYTKVMIMDQKLIDLLIDQEDIVEVIKHFYKEDEIDKAHLIPIDMNSLNNYIDHTYLDIDNATNSSLKLKLYQNLRQAKFIKQVTSFFSQAFNGKYLFPQIPQPSDYGRTYYKGINLQNVSKEVRRACLGDHYTYDLNAAVYSIKLMLAEDLLRNKGISMEGKYTYTKDYLDHKSNIRNKLCQHITSYPNPLKLVKLAITAIGFGARLASVGYNANNGDYVNPAIVDIIKNKEDRERFVNDEWVKKFVKEQKELTKFIVDEYLKIPEFVDRISKVENIFRKNNQFNETHVMSYLFQHTETLIMNEIRKLTDDVILNIHDCVITKNPISQDILLDIKLMLKRHNEYLTISKESVHGWGSVDTMIEQVLHENRIVEEERLARNSGYNTEKQAKKLIPYTPINNDNKCYDGNGYDGNNHNEYKIDEDDLLQEMSKQQRKEHMRIVGHTENTSLPSFIQKLV